ncbi:MAG: InlB B-repeat-containing protein, partial [Clostridia bacterium]|nr:InlB B-repeat-containing protein [Clostridia bacterium]
GSGGFSKVYKIRKIDTCDERDYYSALKIISIPQSSDEYETYLGEGYDEDTITGIFTSQVKRIVEEFHLMSQFKGNSNIVSYEDHMIVPHENGKGWDIFIRMELLTSLTKYCTKNAMSVEETVKLGIGICRALELCQKKNIIHRDIKPQNIFVNEFGDYKLGDFGIAKSMDHTTHATKTGTYSYMAPEVYRGEAYGATIDIYSLGLVLYWLLNERRMPFLPLPPAAPTAAQLSEAQVRRLSGEALSAPKNGGEDLQRIVLKACAPRAEDRYATPTAMRRELEKALFAIEALAEDEDTAAAVPVAFATENEATVMTAGDEKTEGLFGAAPVWTGKDAKTAPALDDERTEAAPFAAFDDSEATVSAVENASAAQEAEEVHEVTVGLFGDRTEKVVAEPIKQPTPPPAPMPQPAPAPVPAPAKPKKSGAGKWLAIIGGALLVVIIAILLMLRGCGGDAEGTLTGADETTPFVTDESSVDPDPVVKALQFAQNDDGTYRVIGIGSCDDSAVSIPATYNQKAVTAIGEGAFAGCNTLKSVTIPASVTHISARAFESCTALESAIFENPNGWRVSKAEGIALLSASAEENDTLLLDDPSVAAGYLTETYVEYDWYRSEEEPPVTEAPPTTEEPVIITVTLHLDADGGELEEEYVTLILGEPYGDLPTPSRMGYSFGGWFLAENDQQITASTVVETEKDHTVYAKWTALAEGVQFNACGGSVSVTDKSVTFGTAYGTLPTPTRAGYTFVGWFTAQSGGQQVLESTIVDKTEPHMLYAHWMAKEYTVLLNSNGGIATQPSIKVTYDATYGTLPTPTRTGHTFDGWYTSATGGTKITSTTKVKIETSQTIYAHWTANSYTVKFDANGGSGTMSAQTMTYGKSASLKSGGFTKENCGFLGWSTSPNALLAQYTNGQSVTNLANSGSITLYAVW